MTCNRVFRRKAGLSVLSAVLASGLFACSDDNNDGSGGVGPSGSTSLPTQAQLKAQLDLAQGTPNGGFSLNMWATVVDRSGIVRAVAFTGTKVGDQWLGSRVISAQKANTANAFSLTNSLPSPPPTSTAPPSPAARSSASRRATRWTPPWPTAGMPISTGRRMTSWWASGSAG